MTGLNTSVTACPDSFFSGKKLAFCTKHYIGLPIGLLLNRIGNPEGYFFSGDPYGEPGSCYLEYEDSIILRIAPKKLEYLKQYNSDNQWDMDTFRLEKIRYISINKGLEVLLFVDE